MHVKIDYLTYLSTAPNIAISNNSLSNHTIEQNILYLYLYKKYGPFPSPLSVKLPIKFVGPHDCTESIYIYTSIPIYLYISKKYGPFPSPSSVKLSKKFMCPPKLHVY